MNNTPDLWLVGCGTMAIEYTKILVKLRKKFEVVGRGKDSAKFFTYTTNIPVTTGGVLSALESGKAPNTAIVAVPVEELGSVTTTLLDYGVKNILIEKPGSLYVEELEKIRRLEKDKCGKIYIAYNRRFYESVRFLKKILLEGETITSVRFEFTEWIHRMDLKKINVDVQKNWITANSSHVLDTVFFLAGYPKQETSYSYQSCPLSWHSSGSIFFGCGKTTQDIPFTYHSDWNSAGRWSIEVFTNEGKYVLCPLEKLQFQEKGSIVLQPVEIDDVLDQEYKPGLYRMVNEFLNEENSSLCSLNDQISNLGFIKRIAGYK